MLRSFLKAMCVATMGVTPTCSVHVICIPHTRSLVASCGMHKSGTQHHRRVANFSTAVYQFTNQHHPHVNITPREYCHLSPRRPISLADVSGEQHVSGAQSRTLCGKPRLPVNMMYVKPKRIWRKTSHVVLIYTHCLKRTCWKACNASYYCVGLREGYIMNGN